MRRFKRWRRVVAFGIAQTTNARHVDLVARQDVANTTIAVCNAGTDRRERRLGPFYARRPHLLAQAAHRNAQIPAQRSDGPSADFSADPAKIHQWQAFARNIEVAPPELAIIVAEIAEFLMAHVDTARKFGK